MIPNDCFIIGSGSSIRQNLWDTPIDYLPIWQALKNKFTLSCNWNFKWMTPTALLFSDYRFYEQEVENLKKVPLVIGQKDSYYIREKIILPDNIFLVKQGTQFNGVSGLRPWYWGKDSWTKGFYTNTLTGLFATTFAILLGSKRIFLLGHDWGQINNQTHFYQNDKDGTGIIKKNEYTTTGVGLTANGTHHTGRYNLKRGPDHHPDYWYKVYNKENDVEIYTVGQTRITVLPNISYKDFYEKTLYIPDIDHIKIRSIIIDKLCNNS